MTPFNAAELQIDRDGLSAGSTGVRDIRTDRFGDSKQDTGQDEERKPFHVG
jgi:hypothetical protein